jgi:RNA polymerase sigma-70 factor (ECF subfamily)
MLPADDLSPDLSRLPATTDAELATRIAAGDAAALEALMRECNRKVFRIARAILKDDSEAEDAVQEAYVAAFLQIGTFRGGSKLSTWVSRIVINEALGRLRKQKRQNTVVPFSEDYSSREVQETVSMDQAGTSPEQALMRSEIRALLEAKIDELPMGFRTVFIMRELEEMTVEETAECLGVPQATVRTRLFRARALLRESLAREIDVATSDAFAFAGARCDRIVSAVLERVARLTSSSSD